MSKILGIVSSFYPDIHALAENVKTYLSDLDKLIIWENTPKVDSEIEKIFEFIEADKVEIRSTGKNEGLGNPFNEAVLHAQQGDFDYLLTMDQDSSFQNNDFKTYLHLIDNKKDSSIAVFAPNRNIILNAKENFVEIRTAISSGAIYPVRVFEKIGLFKEDFFIYMIDIELCFRAKKQNFKTVCVTPIHLFHEEGYAKKSKLGLCLNNYTAQSTYYIIRNTILTWKTYPEFTDSTDRIYFYRYKIVYRFIKIMIEKNKLIKYKALILGLWHGFTSKTGQFDLN